MAFLEHRKEVIMLCFLRPHLHDKISLCKTASNIIEHEFDNVFDDVRGAQNATPK